jgi:glycosyltransferase involved in cell wall biosynthesis
MRLGIDVRYLSHGLMGGVHTYLANLLPALLEQAGGHTVFLYADTKSPFELAAVPAGVTVRYLPYRNSLSYIVHDWLRLPRAMAADRVEVAHFPTNYGFGPARARTVITVHDEINLLPWHKIIRGHRKDPRTVFMMTYLHLSTRAAVRRAHRLLTVSEYARQQIARYSGLAPEKIVSIHHAPAPDWHPLQDEATLAEVRRRYGLPDRFVLADGIKNPGVIVRAWARLPERLRSERRIVFYSRRPDPPKEVFEAVRAGWARLLIRPSRADLMALYSQADAFVFPSWIEGFGLPLLEAMTCGAPVIASTAGAIPEVTGGAARLFEAADETTLAAHLASVLDNPEEANRLRKLGFARAATFSWERTARRVWESYL